jgi:hypothetical protein
VEARVWTWSGVRTELSGVASSSWGRQCVPRQWGRRHRGRRDLQRIELVPRGVAAAELDLDEGLVRPPGLPEVVPPDICARRS